MKLFYIFDFKKTLITMKKKFCIFLILFLVKFSGQEFKVLVLKDSISENRDYQIFEFINDKTNLENLKFLASVSCEGEKNSFSNIYEIAKFESQLLGANSFKFIKKEESEGKIKIYLDIYYSDGNNLILNRNNEEENRIFVFGSDNLNEKKKRLYKLNGKIQALKNREFDIINYKLGETIKIASKEFLSQPVVFKTYKNFKSIFLNTDGWGRTESNESVKDYVIVKIITYELFYQFDKNLGYTLLEINK